jgi:hypothetical protein
MDRKSPGRDYTLKGIGATHSATKFFELFPELSSKVGLACYQFGTSRTEETRSGIAGGATIMQARSRG